MLPRAPAGPESMDGSKLIHYTEQTVSHLGKCSQGTPGFGTHHCKRVEKESWPASLGLWNATGVLPYAQDHGA